MWNNAGLSTCILITTRSPANGMVHHTVARIFVSTKLRDLGPKSSATRTFWRMVATCIRYQPPTKHLLWDLTTFSLASVKAPCVGTGFLGLAYPFFSPKSLDDTPEFPRFPPLCTDNNATAMGPRDVLRRAMFTPLPPVGLLETVLLSLKEGELLSESTVRRLRRREAEMRAAATEGRTPLSEYKRRKQKKMTAKALQATLEQSSNKENSSLQGHDVPSPAADTLLKSSQKAAMHPVATANPFEGDRLKISVEGVERLSPSASLCRRTESHGISTSNGA